MLLRDFEPYGILFVNVCFYSHYHSHAVKGVWALWNFIYECVCFYNRYPRHAVKGLWALWNNIYDRVFSTLHFPVILDGHIINKYKLKALNFFTSWVTAMLSIRTLFHTVSLFVI
jgi:hypothetical protein